MPDNGLFAPYLSASFPAKLNVMILNQQYRDT